MKKILLLIVMLTFSFSAIMAQTTITGKVVSKKDGFPIAGALVQAKDKAVVTTITDHAGNYIITVPADVKVLEVIVPGMKTKTRGIGQKQVINFKVTANKGKEKEKGKRKEKVAKSGKPGGTRSAKSTTPPAPVEKSGQSKRAKQK